MRRRTVLSLPLLASASLLASSALAAPAAHRRWSPARAWAWHRRTPWLVGCNFLPSSAINQLEMWQADSFDLPTIDRELGWAAQLGFNSVRVFLHDLLWQQDAVGFVGRIDRFLATAHKHGIGTMLVLFDGVWDPAPKLGPQRGPRPGVHNSGWVQSPGVAVLKDPARREALEPYVSGIIRRFARDRRVQVWDLFNEPDNRNTGSYVAQEPEDKAALAEALLARTFAWARKAGPTQPLTAGLWQGNWESRETLKPIERLMVDESDVISFHGYRALDETRKWVTQLERLGRPLLCTEFMARPSSTFDPVLGYFAEKKIGAYAWGLVAGKSNTIHAWKTWKTPDVGEPAVWHHDILRADGTPFDAREAEYIRGLTRPRRRAVK